MVRCSLRVCPAVASHQIRIAGAKVLRACRMEKTKAYGGKMTIDECITKQNVAYYCCGPIARSGEKIRFP